MSAGLAVPYDLVWIIVSIDYLPEPMWRYTRSCTEVLISDRVVLLLEHRCVTYGLIPSWYSSSVYYYEIVACHETGELLVPGLCIQWIL